MAKRPAIDEAQGKAVVRFAHLPERDTIAQGLQAMHEIVTDIEIDASAPRVWAALTDFAAYPRWNPVIVSIAGTLAEGAALRAYLRPEALHHAAAGPVSALKFLAFRAWCRLNGMCIPVRVTKLVEGRELRWVGTLPVPGLFDGEHFFVLSEGSRGRVHLTQGERYSGALEPAFREVMEGVNRAGYHATNRALKDYVEQAAKREQRPQDLAA